MDIFLTFCIVTPLVCGLVYILYVNGFMFFESKTALTFRGIQRKGCFGAKFRKCSGITKKVIKTSEERQFVYKPLLENGNVYVTITSRDNSREFIFERAESRHTVPAGRYTITTHFDSATGRYTIEW